MNERPVLGIDIGGSGIKGAPVDLALGDWVSPRVRVPTPVPATAEQVAAVVQQIVAYFADQIGDGPVGVTVPAVVRHGVTRVAANLDESWIGFPIEDYLASALDREVLVVNDADAAGVAEARYGAAQGHPGLVLMTTLGTGIGTALIHNGVLVPGAELGRIEIDGHIAETQANAKLGLPMAEWIGRLQHYYETVERLVWPDLIVVGGGISGYHEQFLPQLRLETPIVPAALFNRAGIIGAARLAYDHLSNRP